MFLLTLADIHKSIPCNKIRDNVSFHLPAVQNTQVCQSTVQWFETQWTHAARFQTAQHQLLVHRVPHLLSLEHPLWPLIQTPTHHQKQVSLSSQINTFIKKAHTQAHGNPPTHVHAHACMHTHTHTQACSHWHRWDNLVIDVFAFFPDFCVYNSIPLRQGEVINDGCDKVCRCEDTMTNSIVCDDR